GIEIELYTLDLSFVFLRKHEHQQSRAAADIQYAGPGRRLVGKPGAEYAGVGADLHGASVLVDGELLEPEIGVGHSVRCWSAHHSARALALTDNGARSPSRYLKCPVMAIMAALSVQYSKGGMKVRQPSRAPRSWNALRSPLLAETPPAMQRSVMPVSRAAFLNLVSRIETMRCWMDAQISARLASINPGFLSVSSRRK